MVAHPDPGHVIRVVVDLPPVIPGRHPGRQAPVRAQFPAVVGPVVNLDPAVADAAPLRGQQLDVVLHGQRHRNIPGSGDQRGVGLVGGGGPVRRERVPQALVRPGLPACDDPLVQQLLQVGERPDGPVGDVGAAAGDVPAGVAGHVLAEQRVDRREGPLHDRLVRPGPLVRRLDRHAQGVGGPQEHLRQEHLPVVDHHRVRDDDRPGGRQLQPVVDADQPLVGDPGRRHRQGLVPARPHRLGHQHPGQQQRRVHRLGADRAQHRGADGPGRDVDRGNQFRPADHPVVHHRHHVQRRAVHLHLLARPRGDRGGEHPLRTGRRLPAGDSRPECVPASRQRLQQPVERRPRRHRHRPRAVLALQPLRDQPDDPGPGPGRRRGLRVDLRRRGRHDPRVHLPRPPGRRRVPGVDQPPQALVQVTRPHPPHRPGAGRDPGRSQLGRLGPLPLGQRPRQVVLRSRRRAGRGARRHARLQLDQVPLPVAGRAHHVLRQGFQQPVRCHHRPRRGGSTRPDDREIRCGQQERQGHHHGLPRVRQQPHRSPGQRHHLVPGALEHHPVPDPQDPRPLSHVRPPRRPARRNGGSAPPTGPPPVRAAT